MRKLTLTIDEDEQGYVGVTFDFGLENDTPPAAKDVAIPDMVGLVLQKYMPIILNEAMRRYYHFKDCAVCEKEYEKERESFYHKDAKIIPFKKR